MKIQKPNTLYDHPFSKAYWRDAALELRDTRMLAFAALMIALRVALKPLGIPLAPELRVNIAFFVNALGAMVFGPVVAVVAACVTDTLGCILFPTGVYFFPFILTEIGGSLIFALFFYRARITPTRVMLSRFCICFFINIVLNAPIMWWYYKLVLGKSYMLFQLPQILKNLFMFPIESVLLTLFLGLMIPLAYKLGLVYDRGQQVKFEKKQLVLLSVLFVVGAVSVFAYLGYYYDHTSLSASYTGEERYAINCAMDGVVHDNTDNWDGDGSTTVSVVESAYRKFLGHETTYTVAVYVVDEEKLAEKAASDGKYGLDTLRGYSKSKAAKDDTLTREATAVVVKSDKTGEVLSFALT